jgi:hypothetical protein
MYRKVLKQTDCTPMESENQHLVSNTNNLFKVYCQNIRGLKHKVQEFTTSLFPVLPHILHLTEHHLKEDGIDMISTENYNLEVKFCRQVLKWWCMYLHS